MKLLYQIWNHHFVLGTLIPWSVLNMFTLEVRYLSLKPSVRFNFR